MSLYSYDQPAIGANAFFGRQFLTRALIQGVEAGRSFALIGGPKTGRTSTLIHIYHLLHERLLRRPKAAKIVPVGFDIARGLARGPQAWVPELWAELERSMTDPHVLGTALALHLPPKPFAGQDNPWVPFRHLLKILYQQLSGTPSWSRYVLLLDNVDALVTRRQYKGLDELGKLINDKSLDAPLAALFSGGRFLREYLTGEDVPLHKARVSTLGALTSADADTMIHLGFRDLPAVDIEAIKMHTGHHPFLMARLLSALEDQGQDFQVAAAVESMREDCDDLFNRIWQELDLNRQVSYTGVYAAPEHALMQRLVETDEILRLKTAEKELGIKPLREYSEMLQYEGVADEALASDQPVMRARCRLWNGWYRERISR